MVFSGLVPGRGSLADPWWVACACGPLATRRKRLTAACLCAERVLGLGDDPRLRRLLDVSLRHAVGVAPLSAVGGALREAEDAAADAKRRAGRSVWSIFEGRRAGESRSGADAARSVVGAVRWALGLPGGVRPSAPPSWPAVRAVLAAPPPTFDPTWRTDNVLALARLAGCGGDTALLPILADALQDAGCEDEAILDHCRKGELHTTACWVPDLVLDGE